MNEEFANFTYKVNQVSEIIKKLASDDKNLQKIGDLEAKQYLGEDKSKIEIVDELNLKVKSNRTIINKKALLKEDNPDVQSQEAFMEEVSKDADRRYKDRCVRKEKMETFKKQATLAFRREEYEKALTLYCKAIEQIKDSCLLYTNRALTYIKLKLYEKAIADCELALRINENSLKARLLLAKSQYLCGDVSSFAKTIEETKKLHPDDTGFIDDFVNNLK